MGAPASMRQVNATEKAQAEAVAIVRTALEESGFASYFDPDATTVFYIRMSEDLNADAHGVARDATQAVRYCKERGISLRPDPVTLLPVFVDNSISASEYGRHRDDNRRKRPAYERIMAMLRANELDEIMSIHMDRLYRRNLELEFLIQDVKDCHDDGRDVIVHTIEPERRFDLLETGDQAMARIEVTMAAQQSDRTHDRELKNNREAREKGWWVGSSGPMGFRRTKEPPFLEPNEDAPIVRKAILDVIRGVSFSDIGREWDRIGIPHPKDGKLKWAPATVRNRLDRHAIAGILTYRPRPGRDGKLKPLQILGRGAWEPLVTEAEWNQFQAVLGANGRKYGTARNRGTFTGVFRCSQCGHVLNRQKRDAQGTWAWTCLKNNHRAGFVDPCGKICILGPEAEAVVRALVTDALQAEGTVQKAFERGDHQAEVDRLNAEVLALDAELAQYRQERRERKLSPDEYFDLRDPTAAEKERVEAELLAAQQMAVRHTAAEVNEQGLLSFVWDKASDDRRNQLIGFMFPYGIRVDPGYGRKNLPARLVPLEEPLTPKEED
jgi:hypothetical protein